MAELRIDGIQWCAPHGHPVLALRVEESERVFVVAMAADDAATMAPSPKAAHYGGQRWMALVESVIDRLGASIDRVALHVGHDHILRSSLRLVTATGATVQLPLHFADGIALAHRSGLPLEMAEADLARVPLGPIPRAKPDEPLLAAFRDAIESLDLDGFAGTAG